MLLFVKAQHGLKLIIYLKLTKSVSRENIIFFIHKTRTAATYRFNMPPHILSTNWTHWSSTSSQQVMSCHHRYRWTTKRVAVMPKPAAPAYFSPQSINAIEEVLTSQ